MSSAAVATASSSSSSSTKELRLHHFGPMRDVHDSMISSNSNGDDEEGEIVEGALAVDKNNEKFDEAVSPRSHRPNGGMQQQSVRHESELCSTTNRTMRQKAIPPPSISSPPPSLPSSTSYGTTTFATLKGNNDRFSHRDSIKFYHRRSTVGTSRPETASSSSRRDGQNTMCNPIPRPNTSSDTSYGDHNYSRRSSYYSRDNNYHHSNGNRMNQDGDFHPQFHRRQEGRSYSSSFNDRQLQERRGYSPSYSRRDGCHNDDYMDHMNDYSWQGSRHNNNGSTDSSLRYSGNDDRGQIRSMFSQRTKDRADDSRFHDDDRMLYSTSAASYRGAHDRRSLSNQGRDSRDSNGRYFEGRGTGGRTGDGGTGWNRDGQHQLHDHPESWWGDRSGYRHNDGMDNRRPYGRPRATFGSSSHHTEYQRNNSQVNWEGQYSTTHQDEDYRSRVSSNQQADRSNDDRRGSSYRYNGRDDDMFGKNNNHGGSDSKFSSDTRCSTDVSSGLAQKWEKLDACKPVMKTQTTTQSASSLTGGDAKHNTLKRQLHEPPNGISNSKRMREDHPPSVAKNTPSGPLSTTACTSEPPVTLDAKDSSSSTQNTTKGSMKVSSMSSSAKASACNDTNKSGSDTTISKKPVTKNKLGIPLRWLKPAVKPKKIAPKVIVSKTNTDSSTGRSVVPRKDAGSLNKTSKEIGKPNNLTGKSTLMVTDSSEGGSTISTPQGAVTSANPKKLTKPVPTAIVTKKTKKKKKKTKNAKISTALISQGDEEKDSMDIDTLSGCNSPETGREGQGKNEWDSDAASDGESSGSSSSEEEDDPADLIPYRKPGTVTRPVPKPSVADVKAASTCSIARSDSSAGENDSEAVAATKLERRRQRKKEKERRLLQKIQSEKTEFDHDKAETEMEEERRKREEAKPLTQAQIRAILGEEDDTMGSSGQSNWVRRSARQPSKALLRNKHMKNFITKLKTNSPDMVVLKLKKYVSDPNAPCAVLDAILDALEENTNCEALYIQNFNEGMKDQQVLHLLSILQQRKCKIWCLNIGENYNVTDETWEKFTKGLVHTKVTHMYASEHTITTDMKDEIRTTIRENRKKHNMHIDPANLDVIVQCTHCWWNPINAKVLRPYLQKRGLEDMLNDKEAQGHRGSTSSAPS